MGPSLLRSGLGHGISIRAGIATRVCLSNVLQQRFFSAEKIQESTSKDPTKTTNKIAETPKATEVDNDYSGKKYESLPISFADISRAEVAIRGGVKRTQCEKSHFISELVGSNVYFKPEFRQFTGSFKERGARNAILQLMREKKDSLRGVIAASAGNHAQALAFHGQQLGVPATVVMPTVAPMSKVDRCRVCSVLNLFFL